MVEHDVADPQQEEVEEHKEDSTSPETEERQGQQQHLQQQEADHESEVELDEEAKLVQVLIKWNLNSYLYEKEQSATEEENWKNGTVDHWSKNEVKALTGKDEMLISMNTEWKPNPHVAEQEGPALTCEGAHCVGHEEVKRSISL